MKATSIYPTNTKQMRRGLWHTLGVEMEETEPWPSRTPNILGMVSK